jgi:uncharacterized membrane protein
MEAALRGGLPGWGVQPRLLWRLRPFAAWQSLTSLSGAVRGADAGEVEAQVHDCTWYTFAADTAWFNGVVWDIGLAALAPDRRRLAVLAATDTD